MLLAALLVKLAWIGAGVSVSVGVVTFATSALLGSMDD